MAADPHNLHPPRNGSPANAGEFLGVGLQFAGAILLFLFLGQWMDARLGTSPWLLMLGVFGGAAAGFYAIYRKLVIVPRDREGKNKP